MVKVIPFLGMSKDRIRLELKYILDNHPELFWFEGRIKIETRGRIVLLYPSYVYSKNECKRIKEEIKQKVNKYNKYNYTNDFHLIQSLYNDFTGTLEYDVLAPHGQNMSSVFINNRSVCNGISKAFQYTLLQNGVFCKIVRGSLDGVGYHVWNVVRLNGEYYHIDVTLGCRYFRENPYFKKKFSDCDFFCISTEKIKKTHIVYSNLNGIGE